MAAVLAYHAIGRCDTDAHNLFIDPETFANQMGYLARRKRVVALEEIVRAPARDAVAITFDDAYRSVYEAALPVLERHGFPATVFLPTAYVGGENVWDEPTGCPLGIMSESELRDAAARGLDVQSHGHEHIDMQRSQPDAVRRDIERSVEILTEITGRRPRFLAYPFRTASQESQEIVAAAGFEAAFSIDRVHEGTFAFERVQVTPRDGEKLFALKTTGRYVRLRNSPFVSGGYELVKLLTGRRP